jgi:hypothetical protein
LGIVREKEMREQDTTLVREQKTDWRPHWGKEFQRKINPLERHKLTPEEKQQKGSTGENNKQNEMLPGIRVTNSEKI